MAPLAGSDRDGLGFFSSRYNRVYKGRAAFTAKSKRWHVLFAALGAAQQELSTAFATETVTGLVSSALATIGSIRAAPHSPQNLKGGTFSLPHLGQRSKN
jgi:hypothetical protein